MARGKVTVDDALTGGPRGARLRSTVRAPRGSGTGARRYAELVRRASLLVERLLGIGATVRGRRGTGAPPASR